MEEQYVKIFNFKGLVERKLKKINFNQQESSELHVGKRHFSKIRLFFTSKYVIHYTDDVLCDIFIYINSFLTCHNFA